MVIGHPGGELQSMSIRTHTICCVCFARQPLPCYKFVRALSLCAYSIATSFFSSLSSFFVIFLIYHPSIHHFVCSSFMHLSCTSYSFLLPFHGYASAGIRPHSCKKFHPHSICTVWCVRIQVFLRQSGSSPSSIHHW